MTIRNNDGVEERFFADRDEMTNVLAGETTQRLADAIARNGHASFVGSGGITPLDLYDRLQHADLDWSAISVALSDERWVSPAMDGSNEKLLRARLLRNGTNAAHLCPLKTAHATAHEAEASVDRAVAAIARPFDVTLLGMGVDGHTASLHPHADGLAEALNVDDRALVRAIRPRNLAETGERISLTLRAIVESRLIVILIQGREKLTALRDALSGDDVLAMPVRAVLHQRVTPVQVFWAP